MAELEASTPAMLTSQKIDHVLAHMKACTP